MIDVVLKGAEGERALWIDVLDPTPAELRAVSQQYGISPASIQECMKPLHLPKHEVTSAATFVLVRFFDDDADVDANDVQRMTRKVALFLGNRFLVTVHRREQPFLGAISARYHASKEPVYLQVVVLDILLAAVETFHRPLEAAELTIHEFEMIALNEKSSALAWDSVLRTKIRVQTIKRLLWHTNDAVKRFVPYSSATQPLAGDLRERLESVSFFAESLDADLDSLLTVQLSLASHRANEVIRLLTVFSVFFLPITFIVGVYGMNFAHMPELQWRYGYLMVWLVIVSTVVAIYVWFRKRGLIGS